MTNPGRNDVIIDCSSCPSRAEAAHCADCIVAFLVEREPGAIVFDVAEERAIRALRDAGLLPAVRWTRRTG